MTGDMLSEDEITAIHEAGHLVSRYRMDLSTPVETTIESGEDFKGRCDYEKSLPEATVEALEKRPEFGEMFRANTAREVASTLCGYAAETRGRRFTHEESSDAISEAIRHDPPLLEGEPSGDLFESIERLKVFEPDEKKRREWLLSLWEEAWAFTGEWWGDIETVSAILLERRTVGRKIIDEMFGHSGNEDC